MEETIIQYLDQLINIVQTGSQELWNIAIRQVIVNGIINAAWAALFIVMGIVGFKLARSRRLATKIMTEEEYKNSGKSWYYEYCNNIRFENRVKEIIVLILTAICFIVAACQISSCAYYLSNPRYYAIRLLIDTISTIN